MKETDLKTLLRKKEIRIGSEFRIPIDSEAGFKMPNTGAQYSLRIKQDNEYGGTVTNGNIHSGIGYFTGIRDWKQIQLVLNPTPFEVWVHGYDGWNQGANVLDNMCQILYGDSKYGITVRCLREKDLKEWPFSLNWDIKNMLEFRRDLNGSEQNNIIIPSKWQEKKGHNRGSYGWYEIRDGKTQKIMFHEEKLRGHGSSDMFYEGAIIPVMSIPTRRSDIEVDKTKDGVFNIGLI